MCNVARKPKKRQPIKQEQLKPKQNLAKQIRETVQQKRKRLRESKKINDLQNILESIFGRNTLEELAKTVGFIKRQGKLSAFAFVFVVCFGFLGYGAVSLESLVNSLGLHFNIKITAKALSFRINSKFSVILMRTLLKKLKSTQLRTKFSNEISLIFSMFSALIIEDSSSVSLKNTLSEHFKGCGGDASAAAFKLDFIYDFLHSTICALTVRHGNKADQGYSKTIWKYLKKGGLVIRDLGYFTVDSLKLIERRKAYYLSRLSITTNIYLNKTDNVPLNLKSFLKSQKKKSIFFRTVYIGESRFPSQLVGEVVPPSVIEKRFKRYKKEMRRKQRPISDYWKFFSGFSLFITNIPEEVFPRGAIIELYKIRWQIELVFKNFKSNLEIDVFEGTNANRIECLIYAKLISIVLIFIIQGYAMSISEGKNVSLDKLTKFLLYDNRLRQAALEIDFINLFDEILSGALIYKQKRKRKTTIEKIQEKILKAA